MTSKVKGPYSKMQASDLSKKQQRSSSRVAVAEEMTAAEIARKQQRIPQFAKALGKGKTAIYKNWHKENVIKPFKGKKGKGLRRLNKGGFVKGPNS